MRQVWALVVVLVALLAVGVVLRDGSGPTPFGPAPAPPEVTRESAARHDVEQMLERRATALEDGDARAYAATAEGALRARDRVAARRAAGLGLTRVRLRIDGGHLDESDGGLDLRLEYGVRGISGSFGTPARVTVRRRGDAWRIRTLALKRGRPPWEVDRFTRVTAPHFVVWAPQGIDVTSSGLPNALEDGYAAMQGVLRRGRLRKRYLVVVAADARQARSLTASIRGLDSLTALTDTEVHQEGHAQRVASIASQRLIVVWPSFSGADFEAQRTVVAHELTHAAVAPATSGRTPAWLVEGLALYVSDDRRVEQAAEAKASRLSLSLAKLSDPDAIAKLSGDAQGDGYAYASAAAFYIAERFGERALLRLYDAYNEEDLLGDPGDVDLTDQAVREALGVPLASLERGLRRWIASGHA